MVGGSVAFLGNKSFEAQAQYQIQFQNQFQNQFHTGRDRRY